MRNKLTFPSAGMETKYVWDRHALQNNGIYIWDKHNIINETKYYWDKYAVNREIKYYWEQYEVSLKTTYNWNRYTMLEADATFAANNYIQQVYNTETKTKYLNLNKDFTTTPVPKDTYAMTGSYVYLYKADNTYIRYNITDVKNNCFTCNPLYYGFVGVSYDLSYIYPYYYFTPNTRMYVDANNKNYLTFTNLYNTTRNTKNKPTSLTDSPTGSYYIELNMKWPTTLKNAYTYSKSSNLTHKFSFISGTTFYEMLNDGFWRDDSYAVGAQIKNENSLTTLSSENSTAYPTGMSGNYLYVKTSNTFQTVKGAYIQEVISTKQDAYPQDAIQGDYWYSSKVYITYIWDTYNTSTGAYLGPVYSQDANAYPVDGSVGSIRYKYVRQFDGFAKYVWDKYGIDYTYKWSKQAVEFKEEVDVYEYTENSVILFTDDDLSAKKNYIMVEETPEEWRNLSPDDEIILYGFAPEKGYCLTDEDYWRFIDAKRLTFKVKDLYQQYFQDIQDNEDNGFISLNYTWMIGFSIGSKTYTWFQKPDNHLVGTGDEWYFKISMDEYGYHIEMNFRNDYPSQDDDDTMIMELPKYDAFNSEYCQFATKYELLDTDDKNHPTGKYGYQYAYNYCISAPSGLLLSSNNPSTVESSFNNSETGMSMNNWFSTMKKAYFTNFPLKGFRYYLRTESNYTQGYVTRYPSSYRITDTWKVASDAPITYVYSQDSTAYPTDGRVDLYYYKTTTDSPIKSAGSYIEKVYADSYSAYPKDGYRGTYWYKFNDIEPTNEVIKTDYIESVESLVYNEYPTDNYQGQYWYVATGSQLFQYLGDYIETVNAETINEYPKDGITGGYWYIYKDFENNGPYKSRWVDEVETNDSASYPTDGIQGNYWYVYKKSYDGYKLQINDWQIKGGVDYKHNINPEKDFTIGCVASAEIDFNYDNTADDFQQYLDADYCDYWTWQPNDETWRLIGRFWLTDAEYNRNLVKVKAFDAILATDAYVDEFIANTTYPISITDFFNNLCQLLGVTGRINSSLANTTFTFQDNFEAINITARQLLQYIAEATGGFIKVEPDGTLYLTTYSSSGKTLDNSNYISYAKQRYTVEPISGLTVKMNSDDLGVSSGDVNNNPYIIENNPLFYTQSDQEISNAVYRLYNSINNKVYRPATIQLLQDFGINCGDIITINGDTFYVMSKELSASGCKLECFGNQYREKQPQSINSDIVALRGKTNELVRDLEKTQSTLTDTANGLQSQITQTASSIRSEVSDNKQELESKIEQTASNITTTVSDNKKELESKINQTAESITQTITSQGQTITEIRQDLDGISLTYNSTEGTASITIGDITISQLVDGKYVDRVVAGIDFSGYCRFSDLSTPGSTVICGDNITTGTISADRINMTGSISWGDLSSSCQDTIASFAGSGGSGGEVPSYIKSTYIDATTIKSPTIYGAKIYAGTSAEGYIKLASTGMNFYSNSGGSVCGIGYYPGKYSLPYIILGQGVDDVGTDKGMIKKYTNGIWIGDSDNISSDSPGGTGIFINFNSGTIQKYINGSVSTL